MLWCSERESRWAKERGREEEIGTKVEEEDALARRRSVEGSHKEQTHWAGGSHESRLAEDCH